MRRLFGRVKNSKKGFTMIEMIVALVILAVMAAIAVPSMLGFIDRANERALLTEARVGLVAAQVIVTENGGTLPSDIFEAGTASNNYFLKLVTGVQNPTGFSNIVMGSDTMSGEVIGITYTNGTDAVSIP